MALPLPGVNLPSGLLDAINRQDRFGAEQTQRNLANAMAKNQLQYQPQGLEAALQAAQLANQAQSTQNQFMPKTLEQQQRARSLANQMNAYKLAQAPQKSKLEALLNQAKIQDYLNKSNQPMSSVAKTLADRDRALASGNEEQAKLLDQYAKQQAAGKQGINLRMGANGMLQGISIGGTGEPGEAVTMKDPRFGAYRSGQGGVYAEKDKDGNVRKVVTPSGAAGTMLQNIIFSARSLQDNIKRMQQLAPKVLSGTFRNIVHPINKMLGHFNMGIAPNYEVALSEFNDLGEESVDKISKDLGIRPTDFNMKRLKNLFTPTSSQTSEVYIKKMDRLNTAVGNMLAEAQQIYAEGGDLGTPESRKRLGMAFLRDVPVKLEGLEAPKKQKNKASSSEDFFNPFGE